MTCNHNPPCSELHLYQWHSTFIAATDKAEAEGVADDDGSIEQGEEFDPSVVPMAENHLVFVDEGGCLCNEDDDVDEILITSLEWICRQRENNETGFIVGKEF